MRHIGLALVLAFAVACAAPSPRATTAPEAAHAYVLATPETGAAPFVADDAYLRALTPADLSIRLHRNGHADVADLAAFYAARIAAWRPDERARLEASFARIVPRLAGLEAWLPDQILVVKVAPDFESGLPHTRGAAISLGARLPPQDAQLDEVLLHETFHVLSRAASEDQRDALYGVVGFVRCASLTLPAELSARLITNPDAPLVRHGAPISASDPELLATPLLVAEPAAYVAGKQGLLDYLNVRLVALHRNADGACALAQDVALTQAQISDAIFAHAGRNTDYLFHPEELVADNFAQMMMGRADAPNPEVYDRLAAVLGIARPVTTPH